MMVPQSLIYAAILLAMTLTVSASFEQRITNSSQGQTGFSDQITMDGKIFVRASNGTFVQQDRLVQYERTIGAPGNKSSNQIDGQDSSVWIWVSIFIVMFFAVAIWWSYRCPTCGKSWALSRTGETVGSFFRGKEDEYICRYCGYQKWQKRSYPVT